MTMHSRVAVHTDTEPPAIKDNLHRFFAAAGNAALLLVDAQFTVTEHEVTEQAAPGAGVTSSEGAHRPGS